MAAWVANVARSGRRRLIPGKRVARTVGDRGRHQHLPRSRQRADARREINRQTLDARMRAVAAADSFAHFSEVHADAHAGKIRFLAVHLLQA